MRPTANVQVAELTAKPRRRRAEITLREYTVFYLMERDFTFEGESYESYLHLMGALFEEWTVMSWAKEEQHRLAF